MKPLKHLSFSFLFALLCLLTGSGCQGKKQAAPQINNKPDPALDTASIHQDLREYEALDLSIADPAGGERFRKILKKSEAMGYHDQTCQLLMDFAHSHANRGNLDSTLYYYEKAKPYCNQPIFDKTLPASFLTEFGAFYHSLRSDNVAANRSYYQALNYLKKHNLTENKLAINLYLYLFATQEQLGHPEQALAYLKNADSLAVKLNIVQAIIAVRTNLGNYYAERKDYKTARKYFEEAVVIGEKNWNPEWDPNILIAALGGKGSILTKTGEAEKAIPV